MKKNGFVIFTLNFNRRVCKYPHNSNLIQRAWSSWVIQPFWSCYCYNNIYILPFEKIIRIHKPNVVQEKVGRFQLHHDTTSNHGLLTLPRYHQNCNHIFSDSSRMIHSCGSRNSSNVWYLKEINPWWVLQYFYPFLNSIICSRSLQRDLSTRRYTITHLQVLSGPQRLDDFTLSLIMNVEMEVMNH